MRPVVVFAYRRLNLLMRALGSLLSNPEASATRLIVYSDGPKSDSDEMQVRQLRIWLKSVHGFCNLEVVERPINFGLSKSIVSGISEVLDLHPSAIFLEEDLVVSSFFLKFMNRALDTYEWDPKVMCISGYSYPQFPRPKAPYFLKSAETWSFGTWRDRWCHFEPDPQLVKQKLIEKGLLSVLDDYGLSHKRMLDEAIAGVSDSWGICWWGSVVLNEGLCLYPDTPHVVNLGFGDNAKHTSAWDPSLRKLSDLSRSEVKSWPVVSPPSISRRLAIKYGRFLEDPAFHISRRVRATFR